MTKFRAFCRQSGITPLRTAPILVFCGGQQATFSGWKIRMIHRQPLRDLIVAQFDGMSPQLQHAARYILDHPDEVPFVSMRELARTIGVQPSTLTRLSQYLGLSGYEEIRSEMAALIRDKSDSFAEKARHRQGGAGQGTEDGGLATAMLSSLTAQIAMLSRPESLERLRAMAAALTKARRVYVLGLRSCHSVAWHFHYVMHLLGERTFHLDGPADTGPDGLMRADRSDVLLVMSIRPYALRSLELTTIARERGLRVLAITDSEVSPLMAIADDYVLCPSDGPTFFHPLTPMLAVSEVLCGLVAEAERETALGALQQADRHLAALNTYAQVLPRQRL